MAFCAALRWDSSCYLASMACVYVSTHKPNVCSQAACLRTKLELSPSDRRLLKVDVIFNFKKKAKLWNKTGK